jgi:hypothetical protein
VPAAARDAAALDVTAIFLAAPELAGEMWAVTSLRKKTSVWVTQKTEMSVVGLGFPGDSTSSGRVVDGVDVEVGSDDCCESCHHPWTANRLRRPPESL